MAGGFAGTSDAFKKNLGGSIKAPITGFLDKKSRRAAIDPLDLAEKPDLPPEPSVPPPPTREDPSIAEAKRKQRQAELMRRGRRASVVTSSRGVEDELGTVNRPEARAAQLLG